MIIQKTIIFYLLLYASIAFSRCQVFFTPRDNIKEQLIKLIKQERKFIDAAIYMFSDKETAQALVDAFIRGVKVRIVLDQISMGDKYGKGKFLQNNGITIFVHIPESYNPFNTPIMHHKFFIFGASGESSIPLLWTGSFNCTNSAAKINDENIILCDDKYAIMQYQECFKKLIERLGYHGKGIHDLQED